VTIEMILSIWNKNCLCIHEVWEYVSLVKCFEVRRYEWTRITSVAPNRVTHLWIWTLIFFSSVPFPFFSHFFFIFSLHFPFIFPLFSSCTFLSFYLLPTIFSHFFSILFQVFQFLFLFFAFYFHFGREHLLQSKFLFDQGMVTPLSWSIFVRVLWDLNVKAHIWILQSTKL